MRQNLKILHLKTLHRTDIKKAHSTKEIVIKQCWSYFRNNLNKCEQCKKKSVHEVACELKTDINDECNIDMRSRSAVSSVRDESDNDIVEKSLYVIRAAADGMMHRAQRMGNNVSEMESQVKDQIRFTVNGKLHIVGPEVGVETRLVRFLRNTLHLTGTKFSCGQGGCGACTVTVKSRDPGTGMMKTRAMNSCLVPVLSCDGWEITTVESLGNKKEGFHPLQSRLAKFNESQCGFCSPGFIMATNSLLNENESPNMREIEHNLDGNICRCTGFRPILDAMKSFAGDDHCGDIEDLAGWVCPKMETVCCTDNQPTDILLKDKKKSWISPAKLSTLFDALKKIPEASTYKLVAGNTGVGVYEDKQEIDHFIDISKIPELKSTSLSPLQVGGGVSLADAMKKFESLEESAPAEFWYLKEFCKQLKFVASTAVRETGSIGGNLMLKHDNPEFQSDVFNLLEVVGAKITIDDGNKQEKYLPSDWMKIKMEKKIILKITFPEVSNSHVFSYYKVTTCPGDAKLKVSVEKESYEALKGINDVFCQHPCDSCNLSLTVTLMEETCKNGSVPKAEVTVTDEKENPIPAASVILKLSSSKAGVSANSSEKLITDELGVVSSPLLVTGSYIVKATANGIIIKSKKFDVDKDEACEKRTDIIISLKKQKEEPHCEESSIAVHVIDKSTKLGIPPSTVLLSIDYEEVASDETDLKGTAVIDVSGNGNYSITVTREGFEKKSTSSVIEYPKKCNDSVVSEISEKSCPTTIMPIVVMNYNTELPIPNALVKVILTNTKSGPANTKIGKPKDTDENGTAEFNVPMNGYYTVGVEIDGFDPIEVNKDVMCDTDNCKGCAPVDTVHPPPSYCKDKFLDILLMDCKTNEILDDVAVARVIDAGTRLIKAGERVTETGLTEERHDNTAEDEQSGGKTIVREDVLVDESLDNEATTLLEKDAEAYTTTKLIENEEESSVKSDELGEETTVKSGEEVIFTIENALSRIYVPVEDDKAEDRTCK